MTESNAFVDEHQADELLQAEEGLVLRQDKGRIAADDDGKYAAFEQLPDRVEDERNAFAAYVAEVGYRKLLKGKTHRVQLAPHRVGLFVADTDDGQLSFPEGGQAPLGKDGELPPKLVRLELGRIGQIGRYRAQPMIEHGAMDRF